MADYNSNGTISMQAPPTGGTLAPDFVAGPMINTNRAFKKLVSNVDRSYEAMKQYRERRTDAIKEMVGKHYSDDGTEEERPVNMLELILNIHVLRCVPLAPAVMVRTAVPRLQDYAELHTLDINAALRDMNFAQELQAAFMEAMISPVGVIKIGIAPSGGARDAEGWQNDAGEAYAQCVEYPDYFVDMKASRWDQISFEGDQYAVPLEWAKQAPQFDPEMRKLLRASDAYETRNHGEENAEDISRGKSGRWESDDYIPKVVLRDAYCPHDNVIFTYAVNQIMDRPLREVPFDGPRGGPYRRLILTRVPSNLMGLPFVANLRDLNALENRLIRRAKQDAEEQCTVIGYQASAADDANRLANAKHRQIIQLNNVNGIKEFSIGGLNREMLFLSMQVREMLSYMAGNVDVVGGLASQAGTAQQESMLQSNSGERIKWMKQRVFELAHECARAVAWYNWTNPTRETVLQRGVPGTNISIPTLWSPETRKGSWIDWNFELVPYSMQQRSPEELLQTILGLFQNVLPALRPDMQQQGGIIDARSVLKSIGTLAGVQPEMLNFIHWIGQQVDPGQPERGNASPAPSATTRTYNHQGQPGGGGMTSRDMMMQMMKSSGPGTPAKFTGTGA